MGKALKVLKNVSASQVKTFLACKRKWHWERIAGFRGKSTRAQRRGTAIHYALELYLKRGEIVGGVCVDIESGNTNGLVAAGIVQDSENDGREEGQEWWSTERFVKAAIPYLPKPQSEGGPEVLLEHFFRIPTLGGDGPPWLGVIDLLEDDPSVRVNDYKTSSDIRRYAAKPAELLEDPQAISYAVWVFGETEDLDTVKLRWLYLETRNKVKVNTAETAVEIDREDAEREWDALQLVVSEMVEYSQVEDSLKVPPTSAACSDFGGCPHTGRCGMSALSDVFSGISSDSNKKGKKKMGFLSGMKKLKEQAPNAGTEEDEEEGEDEPKPKKKKKIKKEKPRPKPEPEEDDEGEDDENEDESEDENEEGVLSEDSNTRETTDEEAEAMSKGKKKSKAKKEKPAKAAKKEKPAKAAKKPAPEASQDFILFIDCVPAKGVEFELLEDVAAETLAAINAECQESGTASVWLLPFGEQKAAFQILAEKLCEGSLPNLVVSTQDAVSRELVAHLVPHAAGVVKGVR